MLQIIEAMIKQTPEMHTHQPLVLEMLSGQKMMAPTA